MSAFKGLLVPNLTPFTADLSPDTQAFVQHAKWLLANGADGLAPFGTTGEAASLSMAERRTLLEALRTAGIPGSALMPGIGACALSDAVEMGRTAAATGCAGALLLPPFFYKGVSDTGLFTAIARTIEGIADPALKIYLYHIPPVSQVGFSLDLVGRLAEAFPGTIAGVKDSSGDWAHTQALIASFPELDIFPGSELFLLQGLRAGAPGCITASGNAHPGAISEVLSSFAREASGGPARATEAAQHRIAETRKALQNYPMIPSLKAIAANLHGRESWLTVRPPLDMINDNVAIEMFDSVRQAGLEMPLATTY